MQSMNTHASILDSVILLPHVNTQSIVVSGQKAAYWGFRQQGHLLN